MKHDTATETPDMTGKVALVTGGNGGLGYEMVKHLARSGVKVFLAARNPERGQEAIAKLHEELGAAEKGTVELLVLDMASLKDVKAIAEDFASKESRLDILINNAAVLGNPKYILTPEGLDINLATNFLGPFVLTTTLLPLLKKTAAAPGSDVRVVNISSETISLAPTPTSIHTWADIDTITSQGFTSGMKRYGASKLSLLRFSQTLQQYNPELTVLSVDPGGVGSPGVKGFWTNNFPWPISSIGLAITMRLVATPEVGAIPVKFAATSPEVGREREKYRAAFIMKPNRLVDPPVKLDPTLAEQTWNVAKRVIDQVLKDGKFSGTV